MTYNNNKWKRWLFSVLDLLWITFIYSNSLKSKASSAAQSKPLEDLIKPPLEAVGVKNDLDLWAELIARKGAHVAEFFLLTVLTCLALWAWGVSRKKSLWIATVISVVAAALDETLQIFSNRGAAFSDVLVDSVGVLLAVILFSVIYKIRKNKI